METYLQTCNSAGERYELRRKHSGSRQDASQEEVAIHNTHKRTGKVKYFNRWHVNLWVE